MQQFVVILIISSCHYAFASLQFGLGDKVSCLARAYCDGGTDRHRGTIKINCQKTGFVKKNWHPQNYLTVWFGDDFDDWRYDDTKNEHKAQVSDCSCMTFSALTGKADCGEMFTCPPGQALQTKSNDAWVVNKFTGCNGYLSYEIESMKVVITKNCKCAQVVDGYGYTAKDSIRTACTYCYPPSGNYGCANGVLGACAACDGTQNELRSALTNYKTGATYFGLLPNCLLCSSAGKECPSGQFQSRCGDRIGSTIIDGVCTPCPDNTYKTGTSRATACLPCDSAAACIPGATRIGCNALSMGYCACNAGYEFSLISTVAEDNSISQTLSCTLCPSGKYKSGVPANEKCTDCSTNSEGAMNSPTGSTSMNACTCDGIANRFKYVTDTDMECRACFKSGANGHQTPYKPIGETMCRSCPDGKWFNSDVDDCVPVPIMQIVCKNRNDGTGYWDVEPKVDSYRPWYTNMVTVQVGLNEYLEITTAQVQSCRTLCGAFEYADKCGRVSQQRLYLTDLTSGTQSLYHLDPSSTNFCTVSAPHNLAISREGRCLRCNECGAGQYNADCGDVAGNCDNDLSDLRCAAGTCQDCMTACPQPNQWLSHISNIGCDNSEATTDYTCVDCLRVKKEMDRYYIVESCGGHAYSRWNPDHTYPLQDQYQIVVLNCNDASSHSSCNFLPETVNQITIPRSRLAGTPIPYCPPGFYIDPLCFAIDTTTWNSQCCLKCSEFMPEMKQPHTYQICDGTTGTDTQQLLTRCENNYYLNTTQQKCIPCDMCI